MPFEFERRAATGRLAWAVESVWFARGRIRYGSEHIAPTGATVAVLNLGDPIVHATTGARACRLRATTGWLCGPHDRPSYNAPSGGTHCYGVVSTPVGAASLFDLEPRAIRGRVVPLEDWQAGPALRGALHDLEPRAGLALLLAQCAAQLRERSAREVRLARAVAWLEAEPGLPVGEIAARLGISHAHLDREFSRVVGLTPRRLASILRVRRMLDALDVASQPDWTEQAAVGGWYDQSHLIRDFKRYTGVSPTAYVAAQRRHLEPSETRDASGFVPRGRG